MKRIMKNSKLFVTLIMMVTMMFASSITAFASLGVDSQKGTEILYVMDVSEAGSFDGNGQVIDIYNCTSSSMNIYINGTKEYTLAANGQPGSVLSYKTGKYSYVFSYEQGTFKLNLYLGDKGNSGEGLGNNSQSVTSKAIEASNKAHAKGDVESADAYQAIAEESMTTYMQSLSEFEANRLKTDDAFVTSKKKNNTKALSDNEIAEKYDEVCEELNNSVK